MANQLQVASTILEAGASYAKGSAQKTAGQYSALQHFNNAKQRLLAGEREAGQYRAKGRRLISDATVAMVAQGGTVDSAMLAKMKKDSDIDAISALYDAKADASKMEAQARMDKMKSKQAYRAEMLSLGSNLLSSASTFKWGDDGGYKPDPRRPWG